MMEADQKFPAKQPYDVAPKVQLINLNCEEVMQTSCKNATIGGQHANTCTMPDLCLECGS